MTRLKEFAACVFAPVSPFLGAVLSAEAANQWLAAGLKLAGIVGTVGSLWWMFRLNRLTQQHAQAQVCSDCIDGIKPDKECPIEPQNRPKNCPLNSYEH